MKKLRDIHYRAIGLLLSGKNQTEVAQELLVHYTTVSTWMHDSLFLEAMEKRRQEIAAMPLIDSDPITIDQDPITIEEVTEIDLSKIKVKDSLENLTRSRGRDGRFRKKP